MKPDLRQRLAQSVETAAQLAEGLVVVDVLDGEETTYSENFACPEHGVGLPELEPRIFSFNSPHGACPRCTGLGAQQEIDPDLLVPDPTLSIDEGALVPWAVGNSGFYDSVIQAIADRYEIPTDIPWQELTEQEQDYFLYGTNGEKVYVSYRNRMGRRRSYMLTFEGIVASLQRRYRETDSSSQRERIEEYMSFRPCPVCKGARPRVGDALGRRGAAAAARDADRLAARRRSLHPRRALDRAAPARQRQADRDARAAARTRQHCGRRRARRADDALGELARRHG